MTCSSTVLLGPWGGQEGTPWSYIMKGEISRISITCDDNTICSICFTSRDKYGNLYQSNVFGCANGPQKKEIDINTMVEKLLLIEGRVGTYNSIETLTSLSFTTSKNRKYGPYGSQKGTEFSCLLSKDPFTGFHGHCSELLNSIGVSVSIKTREIVGPWGAEGGTPWSCTPKGVISRISINYDDVIRSLRFTSKDADGNLEHSERIGTTNASDKYHEINIDTSAERLIGISGTYGCYAGITLVTSLCFITNNHRLFGPFGTKRGTAFSYKVSGEELVTGFHGRAGSLIDAIGVYKNRNTTSPCVVVGPVGGQPGTKWAYQPKGLISRISLTYSGAIHSIRFESVDEKGNVDRSPLIGEESGNNKYEINIDIKNEKINGISGSIGHWGAGPILSALSISTDKKIVYGPFGTDKEVSFSLPVKDGFVSGFHGQKERVVASIGVYVKPT